MTVPTKNYVSVISNPGESIASKQMHMEAFEMPRGPDLFNTPSIWARSD